MWRWILISWSFVGLIAAGSEPADPVPTPDDDPLPTHPDLASDSSSSIRHALQSVLSGGKAFASVLRRLAPTRFSLTRVFIVFLMMTSMGMSSRTCVDHRVPVRSATPFTFCTDYSGSEACLAPIGSRFVDGLYPSEATIAAAFTGITFSQHPGSCPDLVRRLMCAAAADPWSSTLSSDGSAPIPKHLCPALSSLIWDQCKDVAMTPNPFDIVARTHPSRQTLRRLFSSAKSFADAFRSPGRDCYAGVPVDQTKAQPRLPSSPKSDYIGQVCLKRLKFAIGSTFYLGGAPFPNGQRHDGRRPHDPDPSGSDRSRMAIVDKNGIVQIWQIGDLEIIPAAAPWLDLSSQIVSDGQHGLLSLAFHKQFASNGRLFLSMTCDISNDRCHKDGDLVVDEYRVADPSKFTTPIFQKRLLYVDGAFGHSIGGQLLFSPADTENNLFVVIGDGGHDQQQDVPDPLNHGQDLRSLRGKILRLDIDSSSNGYSPYQIPADNPYVGVTDAREEIYAMGFKNPWRCSFDRKHPEFLFCGDLGQHDYEEMDRIIKGGNYGWRFYQGRHTQDTSNGLGPEPIVFPQFEYVHPGKGGPAAIIGGYVYRPETRSTIDGTYIFGDQFGKLMTAIAVPESGVYRLTPAAGVWRCAKDSPVDCGNDIGFVLSFFETTDGAVYVCTSKAIYKISDPDSCSLN